MSSATSIDNVLPPKGGSHKTGSGNYETGSGGHQSGSGGRGSNKESRGFRLQAEETATESGFRIWHFFVLLSLIAATVAVVMSTQTTPQHLILISLAVGTAGVAAYAFYRTVAPFAFSDAFTAPEPIGERLRADLEREKTLVLRSIKELEFDRAMGKLSQQDFDDMAGRLRSRAIGIMKQLDGGGYREIIERDLAVRMGRASSRPSLDAAVTTRARTATEAGVCACGVRNDRDARFCKACGSKLEAA